MSMASLKHFVDPYADLMVVLYINKAHQAGFDKVIPVFGVNYKLLIMDEQPSYAQDYEFARSIADCEEIDRICIRRMLTDFRELDVYSHRMLIGPDVFFFAPPDEVLRFYWSPANDKRVLYASDTLTFRGSLYKLRFFRAPILEGLLGDFYLLAPGVSLAESSIKQCLRLIDSWPVSECKFIPEVSCRSNLAEQHAAAILLYPFGGELLPPERYNHGHFGPDSVMTHWHAANYAISRMPEKVTNLFREALNATI
ncbi:hypothetical protein MKK67_02075 [Methylobacterium sp. J-072]|uniref:hypothetical protein n=1 Tax=Methylobacterium sp. J-072 TaxID=2836651 RepID=UPI001FB968F5|nr:hypothetical protein [Methylobacterium sp. J-072]MCJ2091300.1 hypothetical protein [Methylobacterium sp. J-072]